LNEQRACNLQLIARKDAQMNKPEIASEYMKKGYNCAQAIIKAYANDVGMKEDDAVRMVSSLGGGVGRNGQICGAVSGAALIIGMKFGSTDPANFTAKEKAYNKTNELLEKFGAENKSVLCKELIPYDMKNPEELKKAREAGVFVKQCPLYVSSAGRILESILSSE
jgi:C_GCAxxG_C_C family probable redox protein